MTDTLPVEVNRDGLRTLSAPEAFAADGTFEVALSNHGEGTHVHLTLDADLSSVASVTGTNHYVERDSTHRVRVDVPPGAIGEGVLTVATGYGATTREVHLEIRSRDRSVQVDESLTRPPDRTPDSGLAPSGGTRRLLPVAALVALAVALGIVALAVTGPVVLVLAALAVLAAGLAAAYAAFSFAR